MDDLVACFILRHGTESRNPLYMIAFFILISTAEFVASQSQGAQCVLDLTSSPTPSNYSSCELGNWGGFLEKNCCGAALDRYLYALGLRANQTRQIYLNSGEQNDCLTSMERFKGDVFGCGIEKLTSGGGSCSNFNVTDVNSKMGENLKRFSENCNFGSSDGEQDRTCHSCTETWEEMRSMHPVATESESVANNTDISFKDVLLKGPSCPKVPIKVVYTATNNLQESNFIGQGIAGRVYKGIMPNNQHVAIKHIISDVNVETVAREITSLSHVRHPNLVSLLGCCVNEDECFLVYELCPNGNLSEWLFGKDRVLSWIQRLEIAIDCARGLIFLHTYPEGCIVHRDIKPTNILLGPNFEAKLSDFGLSKVIDPGEAYVSSEVRGTFGYLDPEYQNNRQVNSSGDVYSFGIVLLQILSGKKVINLNQKIPMPLDKMAKALIRGGSTRDFADPKFEGEYSAEAFNITLQLALSCTGLKQQRPSMEQVAVKLVEALEISTKAKASSPELTPEWLSSSTE
ncbi:hypothetical protein NL676_014985 [Syzygium grande]|nr:hypothetical protein NL676_014985 [Syzygium grande]